LKKALPAVLLFVIVLSLSFLWHFPTESLFQYYIWQLEKQSNTAIHYGEGSFRLGRASLMDVDVIRDEQRLAAFDKVDVSFMPGSLEVDAFKGKGGIRARLESGTVKTEMNDFTLVSEGKKLFKQIHVNSGSFTYKRPGKTASGSLSVLLREPLDPLVRSDVKAECQVRLNSRELYLDIGKIMGEGISGSGSLTVSIDEKDFQESGLSGSIKLNTGGTPVTLRISGTIKNPMAGPEIGLDAKAGGG
jgi:hypothetical protein